MQAPALFLDEIILPGNGGEISIAAPIERQLAQVWNLEGFGCVDVVIIAPRDIDEPCTRDNAAPIATLAEVCIGPEGPSGESSIVALSQSHRVAVESIVDTPSAYMGAWGGVFAEYVPKAPRAGNIGPAELFELERRLSHWLLSESCDRDAEDVIGSLAELGKPNQAPWRAAYLIANLVLQDRLSRLEFLLEDQLDAAMEQLMAALGAFQVSSRRQRLDQLAVFLDYAIDDGLERAVDLLGAASVIARHCVAQSDEMRVDDVDKIRSELAQLSQRAHAFSDQVRDLSGQLRSSEASGDQE